MPPIEVVDALLDVLSEQMDQGKSFMLHWSPKNGPIAFEVDLDALDEQLLKNRSEDFLNTLAGINC